MMWRTGLLLLACWVAASAARGIGSLVRPTQQQEADTSSADHVIFPFRGLRYPLRYSPAEEDGWMRPASTDWPGWIPPSLRGKRGMPAFFPLPDNYFNNFPLTRQARSPRGPGAAGGAGFKEVVLPWEMRYFSPMLRG